MLVLHVLAGSIALLAGFAALFAPKGRPLHRGAGTAFALAMLAMSASGGGMALFDDEAGARISVIAALLAFLLVASGWATVRPPAHAGKAVAIGLALLAAATASAALAMAALAAAGGGRFDGMPMPMYLVFGGIAALAAIGDARLLAGRRLDGRQRLARHLWRMGVALLIAAMSFFLGQADEFPAWLRGPATTAGPPLLVLGAVLVHFVRIRWRRRPSPSAPAVA
jgi:hypothetical protein